MLKNGAVPALLVALCTTASHAVAQRVPMIGDLVRLRAVSPSLEVVGVVRSISPGGISIAESDREPSFFVAERITDLEVSQGQTVREGNLALALLSLAAVTGAGAALGAALWSPCEDTGAYGWGCLRPGSRAKSALVGAALTSPLGIIFAYRLGRDRSREVWEAAALPVRGEPVAARVFVDASGSRVGLRISIPFGAR